MDKLIVTGLDALNGEYEFDIVSLLTIGHADSLTNREGHRVKTISGVRAGELSEAFAAGDSDVLVALAAIILARAGKRVDEEQLWDAPMGSGLAFTIDERDEAAEEGDQDVPPALGPLETDRAGEPTTNGGGSSSPTLVPPENGQSPTGPQRSVTPISGQASDPATLAI